MNKIFGVIGIIGIISISILSFIIPNNPFEVIPAITIFSFDKPLWLSLSLCGNFIFLNLLYEIYLIFEKVYQS